MFTYFCGFLLFVSKNSRVFKGDAEPQLSLADHVFKMKFASFEIIHVGQLKTTVIIFWISGRVFFQKNNKLVNRKQPLNAALDKHISLAVLLKVIILEIEKKKENII